MNRKFILLLMLLFAVVASAQVNVGRIYTIANYQSTDAVPGYILDNSGDNVGIGAMDENSFWEFIPTNNVNCYYIKNTVTGRYIQTSKQALNSKVVMGDEPVEFKVLLAKGINDCTYGANVFGVASTDNDKTDFKDGSTVGLNWNASDGGFVQSYGAIAGSNHRSFWKILVAPKSPYTGVSLSEATSQPVYIYNIESGMWLQNNDRVTSEWTTRAQLGTRGIDFTVSEHGSGYYLNAGFGSESISTGFFYDTNSPAEWTVADGDRTYSGNTYTMESGTLKFAVRNDIIAEHQDNLFSEDVETSRYLVNFNNTGIASRVVANFQFVTKEERLEKMERATRENPQDATWLVKSADFANNDTRIDSWNISGNYTRNGDADGTWGRGSRILHNTGAESFSMHQDIDVPNGVYELQVQGFYRDGVAGDQGISNGDGGTGSDGWKEGDPYVEQKHEDGTEVLRGKYFANGVEGTLQSIVDETTKKMTGPNTWSFSHDGKYYYPDNAFCASRAMNLKRGYVNAPIEVAVTDGKLTIGAKKEEGVAGDWLVVDNFKLTYLGMSTAITDMGYSTYVAPYNIDLSDRSDVIAYKVVSVDKAKNTLTLVSVTEIPAGEAVVLKGAEGGYPFAKSNKNIDAFADNLLKASAGFTTDASQKYYCLSDDAGEVGFSPVAIGQEIPAGKGYLVVEGSNAKHFAFVDDVTTGIKPIDNSYTEKRIYNLAGQRLSGVQKGLNIVNGKKVLNF